MIRVVLILLGLSIVNIQCVTIDNVIVTNPSCAGSHDGNLSPIISGVIGTPVYTWTPCCQNGNDVDYAPSGAYHLGVSDDTPSTDTWDGFLIDPSPLSLSYTQNSFHVCNDMGVLGSPAQVQLNNYYGISGVGGTPPYTFEWYFNDVIITTNLNPLFTAPVGVLNTLNLTITDNNGCEYREEFQVIVDDPTVNVLLSQPITAGGSEGGFTDMSLTGIYNVLDPYTWEILDGSDNILRSGNVIDGVIPDQFGFVEGNYKITVHTTGCSSVIIKHLSDGFNVSMPSSIKYCDTSDFVTVTSNIPLGVFSFSWSTDDTSPGAQLPDPNVIIPDFPYHSGLPTVYTLTVTVGVRSVVNNILVEGINLDNGSGSIASCDGSPISLAALPLTVIDGVGPYTYSWSPSTYLDDPTLQNPIVTVSGIDTVIFTVTVTDSTGCKGETSVTVAVENPQITYNVNSINCENVGSFTDITVTGVSSACWSLFKDGDVINSGSIIDPIPDMFDIQSGDYYFELGCNSCPYNTGIESFTTPDNPVITMPNILPYCDFGEDNMIITGGVGDYTYQWSSPDDIVDIHSHIPILNPTTSLPKLLSLEVTDQNGCTDTSDILFTGLQLDVTVHEETCIDIGDGEIEITSLDSSPIACQWMDDSVGCHIYNVSSDTYTVIITEWCGTVRELTVDVQMSDFPDSDGDGVVDCLDGCPNDETKTIPGMCGCGESELDEDGDGIPSCIDLCDIDPRLFDEPCRDVIIIPVEQTSSDYPITAVTIPRDNINLIFNISDNDPDEPSDQLDQLEVKVLPLTEVDVDGNAIQSLDLESITWRNVLTTFQGYEILTSTPAHEIEGFPGINLTYHHYFFRQNCLVLTSNDIDPVDDYGISNKTIYCTSNDTTDSSMNYRAGDSKLTFTVEHWPFMNDEHMIRATYKYNVLQGSVNDNPVDVTHDGDIATVQYEVDSGVILRINFMTTSVLDDSIVPVDILASDITEITVVFHHFEDRLVYDPSLRILFTGGEDSGNTSMFTWKIPLIVSCSVVFLIVVFIIVVNYNPRLELAIHGSEYTRVKKLRSVIRVNSRGKSSMTSSIESIDSNDSIIPDQSIDKHEVTPSSQTV